MNTHFAAWVQKQQHTESFLHKQKHYQLKQDNMRRIGNESYPNKTHRRALLDLGCTTHSNTMTFDHSNHSRYLNAALSSSLVTHRFQSIYQTYDSAKVMK